MTGPPASLCVQPPILGGPGREFGPTPIQPSRRQGNRSSNMRLPHLLWPLLIILTLLGTGWISLRPAPEAFAEGPPRPTTAPPHPGPMQAQRSPAPARRAAGVPAPSADAIGTPPVPSIGAFRSADLPSAPINALLDGGATAAHYVEWYRGTSTEHLCQNLIRLNTLRSWDPETCPCATAEPPPKDARAHDLLHALSEKKQLLKNEESWLMKEVRRQVQADLKAGGSLPVFRLPGTETQVREALLGRSREEGQILEHLVREARGAARRAAFEEEFAAGNYKVLASQRRT